MPENEKKKSSYISGRESRRITRFNRRVTKKLEKARADANKDPALYTTRMIDENNVVEFENVCTYFFSDVGTVKAKEAVRARTLEMLELVGIANKEGVYDMYPHELSGGMRQRICIAIALACSPTLIIADEPTTALDVTIQAQILDLLKQLQKDFGLTYLFISHDLSVVEHISDTIGVMYLGNLVEYAETAKIFANPLNPYTKALFSAIPIPDPDVKLNRIILKGSIPSPANPPAGCKFHTRCEACMEVCKYAAPPGGRWSRATSAPATCMTTRRKPHAPGRSWPRQRRRADGG